MQGCQLRLPAGADAAALQITGLTADSREVRPGFLFAAIAGLRQPPWPCSQTAATN